METPEEEPQPEDEDLCCAPGCHGKGVKSDEPESAGASPPEDARKEKKRTRAVETQTCAEIAPNFFDVLDPNAPSEFEGVVRMEFYPGYDYRDGDESASEKEDDSCEVYRWEDVPSARMEFGMRTQASRDHNEGSSWRAFAWLRAKVSRRDSMVGGEEKYGKKETSSAIPASARSMGGLGDQKRSEPLAQIRPAGFELTEGLLTSHARKGGVSGEGV